MSIAGALVAGGCLPLIPLAVAKAQQSQAAAGAMLDRGQSLLTQQQYQTAKQVLLSIDPSQLSSVDQTRLADLLKQVNQSLAAQVQDTDIFNNAQTSLRDGHLVHAISLYNIIINDPTASSDLKNEAQDNLLLAQAKQQELEPQMKDLLQQAIGAYNAGNLDQADQDLYQIRITGSDLGPDNDQPAQYQYLIAQKRVELSQAALVSASQQQTAAQPAAAQQGQQQTQNQEQQTAAQQAAAAKAQQEQQEQLAQQQQQQEQLLEQKLAQQKAAQEAAEQAAQQKAAAEAAAQAAQQQAAQEAAAQAAQQKAAQEAAEEQAAQEKAAAAQAAQQQATQEAAAQAAQQKAAQEAAEEQAAAQAASLKTQQEEAAEQTALQQQAIQQKLLAQQEAEDEQMEEARQTQAAQEAQTANQTSQQTLSPQETPPPPSVPPIQSLTSTPSAEVAPGPTPPPTALPTQEQINHQRAEALVAQADQAVRAARYQYAISLYNNALTLDPQNEEAQSGLAYAEKLAGGQTPNLLTQTLGADVLAAQRNQVLFNSDMLQSTQALQNNDYATALDKARDALATAMASQQYFTQDQYQTMVNRAQQQLSLVQTQQAQSIAVQKAQQEQEALASGQQIEQQIAQKRQERINQLMGQATEYYKQMQYQQALDTLNQIVAIDPTNNTAQFMQQMVQDQVQYQLWNQYHNLRSTELQQQEAQIEKLMIPYYQLEVYPDDWPQISRLRESESNSSESPADQAIERALTQNLPNITVNQQPFEDVINLLRQETGININVEWPALANAGVQKQTPVTLTLQNVAFSKVLDLILQQVQTTGGTQLGYSVDQGVLDISTSDELAQQTVVDTYDIQDLLVQPPDYSSLAPTLSLALQNQSVNASSTGGGGGGGQTGSNLFGGGGGGAGQTTTTTADQVTQLTKLIESNVDRNSWVDNGGTVGSISTFNNNLIITQTPKSQLGIANLLESLRQSSVEIAIDTRFLVVDTSFLNDFGFTWSLAFPAGFFGNSVGDLTVANNTASIAEPQATGLGEDIAGGFSPSESSLNVSGSIMSNYDLSLMMRATQEDLNVTKLTAPRLILFNGQHSFIAVVEQESYVSNFTQTASGGTLGGVGAIATNLTVSQLQTGVVLDVQATASADNRYVIMNIQPSLATLVSLTSVNVQGLPTGSGANSTNSSLLPGFVQLPNIQLTTMAATVSVPDDGTLLLGGETVSGETEIEAGVPILSKIPIFNTLFTNRSFVRDNGILLILLHPQIIIQKEWEKNQFGQNY